ncbi:MAG: bifunctional DNA primase/polymerase [Ginsengibacter sp.]
MSADLLPAWQEIQKYIDNGISVIPVRDKPDSKGEEKTPYGSWIQQQKVALSKSELFELMDIKYNTTAVGLIGGKVSGNLEIIDIDVKYKQGIDATLFTDLKTLYPDILEKVRIHKTPSGGYHIFYRCTEPVPGNQKLAARPKTAAELQAKPRPTVVNFLETRGEAGYVLAPPALGYTVSKDVPIPVLSLAERNSIISLCRSYNEVIKTEPAVFKPSKADDNYYDLNPFEDFNRRCDPTSLMQELGWSTFKHNNHFIWYTRPGKSKGVSMSFNLQKRFYYCFTASTELEENKGYSPANLLAVLKHGNDKKRLYADLVNRGYGMIKPKVEQRLIKAAVINGQPLPSNVSQGAAADRQQLEAADEKKYPFNKFWFDSADKGIIVDRFKLYTVASGLGFRNYKGSIVQVIPFELSTSGALQALDEKNATRHFSDTLKNYIKEEDADLHRDIFNALDAFLEKHSKHITANLPILNIDEILTDSVDTAFKVYKNGIIKITADTYELLPVTHKLIWRHKINDRSFNYHEGGCYLEFLKLATDWKANSDYILSIIGFLAHEFKDETAGYITVLTEQCENPKDGGGAGKNVFSELFKYTTGFLNVPGSQLKLDKDFLQVWGGQNILCISDVDKKFKYSFLKELSTGSGLSKVLYQNMTTISSDVMPKFLIQTNFSFEVTDGGLKRRIKPIEFTNFFTKAGGLDVYFGKHFPRDWTNEDWNGYDTVLIVAIQLWLRNGRKIADAQLTETGWMKQFEQVHKSYVCDFIISNIDYWVQKKSVDVSETKVAMDRYIAENNIKEGFTSQQLNKALEDYCLKKGIKFESRRKTRINSLSVTCREFIKDEELPF